MAASFSKVYFKLSWNDYLSILQLIAFKKPEGFNVNKRRGNLRLIYARSFNPFG